MHIRTDNILFYLYIFSSTALPSATLPSTLASPTLTSTTLTSHPSCALTTYSYTPLTLT